MFVVFVEPPIYRIILYLSWDLNGLVPSCGIWVRLLRPSCFLQKNTSLYWLLGRRHVGMSRTRLCLLKKNSMHADEAHAPPYWKREVYAVFALFCICGTAEGQTRWGHDGHPRTIKWGRYGVGLNGPGLGIRRIALYGVCPSWRRLPRVLMFFFGQRIVIAALLTMETCPSGFLPLQNDRPRFSRRMRILVIMGRLRRMFLMRWHCPLPMFMAMAMYLIFQNKKIKKSNIVIVCFHLIRPLFFILNLFQGPLRYSKTKYWLLFVQNIINPVWFSHSMTHTTPSRNNPHATC